MDACSAKANPERQHLEHPYVHISSTSPHLSSCYSVKVVRQESSVGDDTSKPGLNRGFAVVVSD